VVAGKERKAVGKVVTSGDELGKFEYSCEVELVEGGVAFE
jgi:hypothetical protein